MPAQKSPNPMQAPARVYMSVKSKYSAMASVPALMFHKLMRPMLATAAVVASYLTLLTHGSWSLALVHMRVSI